MTNALDARLMVHRGDFVLDASLRVDHGEIVALLGPNGSGKSTLLAALAGLLLPETGTIIVSGRVLTRLPGGGTRDRGGARVQIAPENRSIGLLGQDPLLFPHLSAEDNVAFGQRSHGIRQQEAVRDARDWLAAVGLAGYGRRKPVELSGGQQQRVAIARALAARPGILLLDEPLAALDVQTAVLIRQLLREQLVATGTTAILVTHDVLDALVVADRVAILHDGRIVDDGPKARVLGQPSNRFIAALAGVNLVQGTANADGMVLVDDGRVFAGTTAMAATAGTGADGKPPAAGAHLSAVFPPGAVTVHTVESSNQCAAKTASANRWMSTVVALEPSSGSIRVRTDDPLEIVAELSPARVSELALQPGRRIQLSVPVSDVALYEPVLGSSGQPGSGFESGVDRDLGTGEQAGDRASLGRIGDNNLERGVVDTGHISSHRDGR